LKKLFFFVFSKNDLVKQCLLILMIMSFARSNPS
jgi:hypothetical protein